MSETRSAYIHVPFCRHRCPYCNFTVIADRDDLHESFVDAIEQELSWLEQPSEVDTLFFGGGTPTELSANTLEKLFENVHRWLPAAANAEISVEANPEDITEELVLCLAQFGVNRLSLGAQSINNEKLSALGRSHTGDQVEKSFQLARERFDNVSIDLIFAAPDESAANWRKDVEKTIGLRPDHVSTYGLTYELGTRYWSRLIKNQQQEVGDATQRQMYEMGIDLLTSAGFTHYEVSNFALAGKECRHNEVYWTGGNYLAFGPGAARHIDGLRETNHRSTTTYLKRVFAGKSPVAEREELDAEARARERLVFGLRRLRGVDTERFAAETGFAIGQLCGDALDRYIDLGLLEMREGCLRLTRDGLLVSDSIWPDFL